MPSEGKDIKVSVIIPTKNAERFVEDCVKGVLSQDFDAGEIETIIVDNFSDDRTKLYAQRLSEEHNVKFFEKGPERSAQRNFGAQQAGGKYLIFIDVDMVLSSNVIRKCYDTMENNSSIAGCFVKEKIVGKGFWIKVRNFERSFYDATVLDAVRFLRREDFIKSGGYDTDLYAGEDWDLDRKLQSFGSFVLVDECLYHNEGKFSIGAYLKKKFYYSANFDKYISKWGNDDIIKKQFGLFYRFFGVFFENGKWKRFLSNPIMALSFYILKFLVGAGFILAKLKIGKAANPYEKNK